MQFPAYSTAIGEILYKVVTSSYHLPNNVRQTTEGELVGGFPVYRRFCYRPAAISAKWS